MNVGDIVRVTSPRYPDCAVEGVLISINEYGWPVVSGIWNKEYEVSLEHFDVKVIRAVEPEAIGSVFIDEYGNPWTKYSAQSWTAEPWIGESGITSTWEGLQL